MSRNIVGFLRKVPIFWLALTVVVVVGFGVWWLSRPRLAELPLTDVEEEQATAKTLGVPAEFLHRIRQLDDKLVVQQIPLSDSEWNEIVAAVGNPNPEVRCRALECAALSLEGPRAESARVILEKMRSDLDARVRKFAVWSFGDGEPNLNNSKVNRQSGHSTNFEDKRNAKIWNR